MDKAILPQIHFEQLLENLQQAYREAIDLQLQSPKMSLLKAREIVEAICKHLAVWEFAADPSGKTLHKLIERLRSEKVLPSPLVAAFRTVQSYGNLGAHAIPRQDACYISPEYAQPCLDSLSLILEWFSCAYRPPVSEQRKTPFSRQRRIDAALPSHAEIQERIQLFVQVRFPEAPILGSDGLPGRQKPDGLAPLSEQIAIRFPVDEQSGKLLPTQLRVIVTAPDFSVHGKADRLIEIPPNRESNVLSFLLTARQRGCCLIQVEIYDRQELCLGTLPVETNVDGAEQSGMNVTQFVFLVGVADSQQKHETASIIQQFVATLPQLASFHHCLENEQVLNALSRETLQAIAPEQAALNAGFVSSLLQMASEGHQPKIVRSKDTQGGFGCGEIMAQVVVPLMVKLLSRLLNTVQEITLEEVKADPKKIAAFRDALNQISVRDVQPFVKQLGSSMKRSQMRRVTEEIKQVLEAYINA